MPPQGWAQKTKTLEQEVHTVYHHVVQAESVRLRKEEGWSNSKAAETAKKVGEVAKNAFLLAARAQASNPAERTCQRRLISNQGNRREKPSSLMRNRSRERPSLLLPDRPASHLGVLHLNDLPKGRPRRLQILLKEET